MNPFLIQDKPKKESGFTAVIAASDNANQIKKLIDDTLTKCPSLRKIELLWFGRHGQSLISYLARHKYMNKSKKQKVQIRVTLMKIKQIGSIFYPLHDEGSSEAILLIAESANLFIDAYEIEKAYEYWLSNHQHFIAITRRIEGDHERSLLGNYYFYHRIYNHYYSESFKNLLSIENLNYFCEIYRMNSLILNMTNENFKTFAIMGFKNDDSKNEKFDFNSCKNHL